MSLLNFNHNTERAIWKSFKWKKAKLSHTITQLYTKRCIDYIFEQPICLSEAERIAENFFINLTEVVNYGQQLRADYSNKKEAYEALLTTNCTRSLRTAIMMYYKIGHTTFKIRKLVYQSIIPKHKWLYKKLRNVQ